MIPNASFIPFWTLVRKEVMRVLRIWSQSIVPPILTSSLFIIIFGTALGSHVPAIHGVPYLAFIVPGLVMMGIIMSAYASTSFSLFISKFQNSIQELLVSPISYWQIIWGLTIGAIVRASLVGLGIGIVGLLLTPITIHNVFVLIFFVIMTSLLFSFAGIVTALWASNFDQMNVFSTFVITPLTYLGGIFYTIGGLPEPWQTIAKFNPILYIVDGFRYGFLGASDIPLVYSMLVTTVLTAGFFIVCVHLFKKGYKIRS